MDWLWPLWRRVAAGAAHSLILTTSGQVYSFGQATYGALGHGSKEDSLDVPRQVMRLWHVGVVQVCEGPCCCGGGSWAWRQACGWGAPACQRYWDLTWVSAGSASS